MQSVQDDLETQSGVVIVEPGLLYPIITIAMTEATRSNAWFEACCDSGLLDEHICVTPYCVNYDGLAVMVAIVVFIYVF